MSLDSPIAADHPAPFSLSLIPHLIEACRGTAGPMYDPFAGIGRGVVIADALGLEWFGCEIEPEWACADQRIILGDSAIATTLLRSASVGVVCTSPAYGNRLKDQYLGSPSDHALVASGKLKRPRRRSYAIYLGRRVTSGSSGSMTFGVAYRALHTDVWAECWRLLRPGGRFVLNCSNFIQRHKVVDVVGWHVECLESLGSVGVTSMQVGTPGYRDGTNSELRTDGEFIVVFDKPLEAL